MGRRLLVLKLGGSLAQSGRLKSIVEIVSKAARPVVIVPGGGPFADAVRAIQPQMALSDAQAHRLALLAMHQMALVFAGMSERFVTAEYLPEMFLVRGGGPIPVWLPYALQHHDDTLPADWSVTSDALAARLAERLKGAEVVLVKSCAVPLGATLEELTSSGVADPFFAQVVRRAGLRWQVFGAGSEGALSDLLHAAHGRRIQGDQSP